MREKKETTNQNNIKLSPYRNRWRARCTVTLTDGTKERIDGYGETEDDALAEHERKVQQRNISILKALEAKKAALHFSDRRTSGEITVCEAIEARLFERESEISEVKGRPVRDTTISAERSSYKTLVQTQPLGQKLIKDVSIYDLVEWRRNAQNYISTTRKKPLSASYKNRSYVLLEMILNDYYRYRDEKNPISSIDSWVQKRQKKSKNDFLVGNELKEFIHYCENRKKERRFPLDDTLADMYILQLLLYRRPGEIRGLKAKDWNSDTNTLTISRTGKYEDGRTKSESSKDPVEVFGKCADILNCRVLSLKPNDYLFPNRQSANGIVRSDTYNKTLKKWLSEMGIVKDLHAHSLRGSGISYAQYAGANPNAVSANAGHSDARTTQEYYTVCYDEAKHTASQVMANAFM